jgi:hypothetical protein
MQCLCHSWKPVMKGSWVTTSDLLSCLTTCIHNSISLFLNVWYIISQNSILCCETRCWCTCVHVYICVLEEGEWSFNFTISSFTLFIHFYCPHKKFHEESDMVFLEFKFVFIFCLQSCRFAVMCIWVFFIHLCRLRRVLQLLHAGTKLVLFVVNSAFGYIGHTEVIKGIFS